MSEQSVSTQYLQLNVRCNPEFSEVLIAELSMLEFDTFEENRSGFSAFAEEEKLDFDACKEVFRDVPEGRVAWIVGRVISVEFFLVKVCSTIDGKDWRRVKSSHLECGQEEKHFLVV